MFLFSQLLLVKYSFILMHHDGVCERLEAVPDGAEDLAFGASCHTKKMCMLCFVMSCVCIYVCVYAGRWGVMWVQCERQLRCYEKPTC